MDTVVMRSKGCAFPSGQWGWASLKESLSTDLERGRNADPSQPTSRPHSFLAKWPVQCRGAYWCYAPEIRRQLRMRWYAGETKRAWISPHSRYDRAALLSYLLPRSLLSTVCCHAVSSQVQWTWHEGLAAPSVQCSRATMLTRNIAAMTYSSCTADDQTNKKMHADQQSSERWMCWHI